MDPCAFEVVALWWLPVITVRSELVPVSDDLGHSGGEDTECSRRGRSLVWVEGRASWVDTAGTIWFGVMVLLVVGVLGRWIWRDVQQRPLRSVTAQECVEFWNAAPPMDEFEAERAFVVAAGPSDIDEASCLVSLEAASGAIESYWALKSWLTGSSDAAPIGWDRLGASESTGRAAVVLQEGQLQLVDEGD